MSQDFPTSTLPVVWPPSIVPEPTETDGSGPSTLATLSIALGCFLLGCVVGAMGFLIWAETHKVGELIR